ncbi:MAG: TRAP transporter fused permease subunit [Chloroflexi bacterium]|nr:TRAP transporter fused permease subunit [Chloroflexota bacterium]
MVAERVRTMTDDRAPVTPTRRRNLAGAAGILQCALLCSIPILGIFFISGVHTYLGIMIYTQQYIGLFLTLVLVTTFLLTPATRNSPRDRVPWYDMLLALASLPTGLFIAILYPEIAMRMGDMSLDRVVMGTLAILLVLEASRRLVGWAVPIVVSVFILYGRFADLFPGPVRGMSTSWERLSSYLYLDPNSMLSLVALGAGIALAFVFFGQILLNFGGGAHLTNMSILAFGRSRGGSAKAAVVASSLVGTMTGGPMTNVMITGSVTIPMMIRAGYSPAMAGAVEAVASSGGQIMPPVMGAVAFLIAENLGMPYADIALAAAIPAILFYLAVFAQVDLEAGKVGIRGAPSAEIPRFLSTLREASVVVPCLGTLVYTLFVVRLDPSLAGVISGIVSIPFLLLARAGRGDFIKRIFGALQGTGAMVRDLGVILAAAGFIVGVAGVSGLGFNLAYTLVAVGQSNLLLLLVLSAIVCVVLGMGMPTVPAYTLVAVLAAPAIVQLGVMPLAAHLFIFYFAIASSKTPPVALACFAASTISGADPYKISYIAMRLGVLIYVLPFLFVFSPALILRDSPTTVILTVVTAVVGTIVLSVALIGYLRRSVPVLSRALLGVAGAGLWIPLGPDASFASIVNTASLVLAALVLTFEWHRKITLRIVSR